MTLLEILEIVMFAPLIIAVIWMLWELIAGGF